MFSERLENLIQAALQDGKLTEQEKNAIIKRAEAEGEDINEVDIYIQSLMQERQQQLAKERQEAETARIVEQKKEREARMASEIEEQKQHDTLIRKCPVCGAIIPALTNVCPGCHHVINSYEADKEAMKLMEEILVASNHMEVNWDGVFFSHEERYEKYFPMLAELESLYGKLPKVQEFLLDEKKKRLKKLSEEFLRYTEIPLPFAVENCLKTIINEYGSMPEAQALIPDYKEKLETIKKKEKKEKVSGRFKKIGCLIIIIIVIALLCLPQISKFLKGSISTEEDHVESSSLVMDDSENEVETDKMDNSENEDETDGMNDDDESIQEQTEQQMEKTMREMERIQEQAAKQMERVMRERERRK